jgi:hypothetical protein
MPFWIPHWPTQWATYLSPYCSTLVPALQPAFPPAFLSTINTTLDFAYWSAHWKSAVCPFQSSLFSAVATTLEATNWPAEPCPNKPTIVFNSYDAALRSALA